ncbi:hypothetical protein lerEdw1_008492 [Lerista edwardsae]|nr:hypothetical protein lerEdw1_008492 [Lerista edwardsae]
MAASSNNPRKFSEKIALHNQKQAEETAAFEEVMKDLSLTRAHRVPDSCIRKEEAEGAADRLGLTDGEELQLQKTQYLQLGQSRGQYYGGSLPNVNQIGSSAMDLPFQAGSSRPKSCEVPGINIFPSADQENTTTLIPATHNTGGSLPDLTNIHFPSPLPTPLDPEESTFPSLSSSNSTGNLAANLTHMGISTANQGMTTTQTSSQQHRQPAVSPLSLNTDSRRPQSQQAVAMDALSMEQQLPPYPFFTQTSAQQQQQTQVASALPPNAPLMQTTSLQRGVQLPPLSVTIPSTIPQSPPGSQTQTSMGIDISSGSLQQYRSNAGSPANQSPTSPVSNQAFSPGSSPQQTSILGSVFGDSCYDQQMTTRQANALSHQLEQFNMIENAISSNSLYSPCSTLNYSQAAMMGLTGSHGSLQDSQQLSYASHGNIPNIILTVTGESPPSLSKDLTSSLAGVGDVSFDSDSQFPLDELKIDPLTLDGLHMLNDPDMVLADPATEDTFRMDRL